MYDISDVLPGETPSEFAPGTNVLIEGPAMSGKQALALELLGNGFDSNDGVLYVTTDDSASAITEQFDRTRAGFEHASLGLIDCSGSNAQQSETDCQLHRVTSPADLTGISIATAKMQQYFHNQNQPAVRHGVDSLSTLLRYLDVNTVFKFLHVYTSRIADTDGLGVFTINNTAQEPNELNTIRSEFDGMIELRESRADGREVRVRGLASESHTGRSH